jgi:DNA helicase-2/ATP-dependent DNA helicase PcrA
MIRDEGRRPSDLAVLYRSNGQSRLIEENLREQGVAHRVVGGMQFFERKEVKDVIAYLKVALNPADEISLRRVINHPPRGIGEVTLEKLASHALSRGWSLYEAVDRVDALDDVGTAARDGCKALAKVVAEAQQALAGKRPPSEVARTIVERIELKAEIDSSSPNGDAAAKRWANVESILGTLARREAREGPGTNGLAAFLHLLTMDSGPDDSKEAGDVVTLSTLHGSKGLEFDVVFLIGCEEGYLPHARTLDARATEGIGDSPGADIEEERRLFYVGVTRARDRLLLSRAKARAMRGKAVPRTPSRFLLDVPPELLDEHEVNPLDSPTTVQEAAANAEAILAMLQRGGPAGPAVGRGRR